MVLINIESRKILKKIKEKIYFEDRRPAANIDPYLATYTLFKTCCFEETNN